MLLQPPTQASVINSLKVTADGRQIEPRTAIIRIMQSLYSQYLDVCILSFHCSLSLSSKAGINKRDAHS